MNKHEGLWTQFPLFAKWDRLCSRHLKFSRGRAVFQCPQTAEVLHLFHNFPSSPLGGRPGSFHALSTLFLSFLLPFSIFFFFKSSFSYSLSLSLFGFCARGRDEWLRKEGAVRNWGCCWQSGW